MMWSLGLVRILDVEFSLDILEKFVLVIEPLLKFSREAFVVASTQNSSSPSRYTLLELEHRKNV